MIIIKGRTIKGPYVVTSGLVLYLDAGNTRSYPGSGNTWYDISGKGYNATLFNSPSFSNGFIQFRAATTTSQFATTSFNEGVLKSDSSSFTLEVFFKYVSTPPSDEAVVIGRSGSHGGIYLYQSGSIYHAIKTNLGWTGAQNYLVNSITAGQIYHSVLTYNGATGVMSSYSNGSYVTGATFDKTTYDFFSWSDVFYIGGIPSGNPQLFTTNTDVSIVRCYNKLLSATEVLQNYNAQKAKFGLI